MARNRQPQPVHLFFKEENSLQTTEKMLQTGTTKIKLEEVGVNTLVDHIGFSSSFRMSELMAKHEQKGEKNTFTRIEIGNSRITTCIYNKAKIYETKKRIR